MLDFRKLATKAGAMALARRKASDWHTTDVAPTSAQESTARLVVDATLRELEVDKAYMIMIELVESAVPLKGQDWQWIHVSKDKLEQMRLLCGTISDKVAE
jgi:hypothetical protein